MRLRLMSNTLQCGDSLGVLPCFVMVAVAAFVGGCTVADPDAGERPATRVPAELTEGDLAQFAPISDEIKLAPSLTVYEGLPRNRAKLKTELATKKTIRRDEYYTFYARPWRVGGSDAESLRRLSTSADSFEPHREKLCDGFHPDYCLVWTDGNTTCEVLICFGCAEVRFYSPQRELHVDLRGEAYEQFTTILKAYRPWFGHP